MPVQKKEFLATDENMAAVNDFIHSFLPDSCPLTVVNYLDLAVEEIYINIAHYAYAPNNGPVEITCETTEKNPKIKITFCDQGKPFDPIAKNDPDISLSAEERDIGGLGIFLTKKFMDKTEYKFENGKNILTIEKSLA